MLVAPLLDVVRDQQHVGATSPKLCYDTRLEPPRLSSKGPKIRRLGAIHSEWQAEWRIRRFWRGSRASPAESNAIYAVIRRATGYISDYIGTLDDPELAPYVRAKIHLFSRRVRRWAVWEEKYGHGTSSRSSARPLIAGCRKSLIRS
jgi:hypothetical protein